MKQFIVILFLIIGATQIKAAGSYTDLFHIGKVGTTANTILEIGDSAEFRFNFSTLKMEVSNDGINYFEIIDRLLPDMTKGQILSGDAGTLYSVLAADTNGKFLSLNSATATGLEWLDIPAGTPTLAKGGLITHSSVDVAQAVGSNGQVLTADSAQANGIKWATPVGSDHTISSTNTLTNKTISSLSNVISNINTGDFQAGAIDTDLTSVSASDNTLASAKAIKTYVDASGGGGGGYTSALIPNQYILGVPLLSPVLTLTSTGRPIKIGAVAYPTVQSSNSSVQLTNASGGILYSTLVRTSAPTTTFNTKRLRSTTSSNFSCSYLAGFIDWSPPVGSVSYQLTWNRDPSNATRITYCQIYAIEL